MFVCVVVLVNVLDGVRFSYWPYLTKVFLSDQKTQFLETARQITVEKYPLPKWGETLMNFSTWAFLQ